MFCSGCNQEVLDDYVTCPNCGSMLGGGFASVTGTEQPKAKISTGLDTAMLEEPENPLSIGNYIMRPFKDPEMAKKILIGGLISIIPVVGAIIIFGYEVEYIQRIINRRNSWKLPGWENWNDYLNKGIMLFLASLVYWIALIAACVGVMIPFWGGFVMIANKIKDSENPAVVCGALSAIVIPIIIIVVIACVFAILFPILKILYARTLNFKDAFDFRSTFGLIFVDSVNYLITIGVIMGIGMLVGGVLSVFSIISIIPFLGQLVVVLVYSFLYFALGLISVSAFAEFFYKNRAFLKVRE